jgi:hypothetical protein
MMSFALHLKDPHIRQAALLLLALLSLLSATLVLK